MRFVWAVLAVLMFAPKLQAEGLQRVAWFSNLTPGHRFWEFHKAFVKGVCEDLGCKIEENWARMDHFRFGTMIDEAAMQKKVQAAIILNFKKRADDFLERLEKHQVYSMTNVTRTDPAASGKPRERYKYWLGEMIVDEVESGYQQAKQLFSVARERRAPDAKGPIQVAAITGDPSNELTKVRTAGLLKAVAEVTDIELVQTVNTKLWSEDEGETFASHLLDRYPNVTVIWTATDDIALGAVKGVIGKGRKPGQDVLIGGIGGVPDALQAVSSGQMVTTLLGAAFHGGWATILMHDYMAGIDFASAEGLYVKADIELVTQKNAADLLQMIGGLDFSKIDLKRLTRSKNPKRKAYEFSLKALFEARDVR